MKCAKLSDLRLVALLQLMLLFFGLNSFAQTNTWQQKASLPAVSRFLATSFSIGNKGYLGLGFTGSAFCKDFWEYDPISDTWTQKADFAGGNRSAAAGFAIGTKGYVGTGSLNPSDDVTKEFWEFEPATNTWTRKADFAGTARTVAQGLSIGNKGYIGLGRTGSYGLFDDFWEYNPVTDTWTQKANFAGGARYATSGFTIGSKGYIGTGTDFTGGGFTFRNDFWEYDQSTDSWTRKADFAGGARETAVGFSIANRGYIGTGYGASDFWEYNPSTNVWTRKADFGGGGRNMATGFSVNGKGYLGTGAGGGNDLWQYTPMATPPTAQWAKSPGGVTPYSTPTITTDANGNTYVAGAFDGTLTFQTSPSPTVLTSAGESDVFIAKYDATGKVVWAKQEGSANNEGASAIKFDGLGNLYVAGYFSTSTNFDGTVLNNPTTASNNIFIAKFTASSGSLLWIKQGATTSCCVGQSPTAIAVDKSGSAYITGLFSNVTFDPLPAMYAGGASPYNGGWYDVFVVKYSSDGVPQWQTSAGSAEPGYFTDAGNGIAVDASGNVFVTGAVHGSATYPAYFGNTTIVTNNAVGYYETDFFLAKYNQLTSSWEWVVNGGGPNIDYGKSISLDNLGNAYIAGYFEGTGTFGSTTLTSGDGRDYFIAKYDGSGNQLWIHPVEGATYFTDNTSKVDSAGNFYFAATFGGTVTVGDQTLNSAGNDNTYVSSWDKNGEFQWVKQIPGNYYSHIFSLDIDGNSNIHVATVFDIAETFDCTTLNSVGHWDLAVAKLGYTNGSAAPTIQASTNNVCSGSSSTLSIANGNLNNATDWKWYTGSCGGTLVGTGPSVTLNPTQNTTYFARSEGGCAGPGNCGSILITVDNTSPVISSVSAPLAPAPVNTSTNLSVSTNNSTIASAKIKWGDASGDQIVTNPSTNFTVPHTYTTPGVYTVVTTITDACGNTSAAYQYQYIVVYDPSAGFVTGGGWINSSAGAYRPDTLLNGKAIFGFESRYQNGATVPSGNTEFKFQVANMNFKSTNYQWLVVSGSRAQFKGSGTINGIGNYGFILTAVDGDLGNTTTADLFRIKIWNISTGTIVYDNQYGTSDDGALITQIGGGSVVIHNNKSNTAITTRDVSANGTLIENKLQVIALPNPTRNYFSLVLKGGSDEKISIRVLDVLGRVVEIKNKISTNKTLTLGENYKPGTYLIEVIQGTRHQTQTVIKQ